MKFSCFFCLLWTYTDLGKLVTRGGVEDKRLKAKDRPSRGQGHRRKCSAKKKVWRSQRKNFFQAKKVFKNFFSGDLYLKKPKKKVLADFPQGFWRFPTKFQRFKNSAVLEPRTGQFSRTWGFEAKDYKMYPRGLHLCSLHYWYMLGTANNVKKLQH